MNYTQAREYIENAYKTRGSVYGLESITALMEALDRPERKLKIIHIAGTNGKGSVGAFIERMLRESGYKTGRFVSPTVYCYEERFQIDGKYISDKDFAQIMTRICNAARKIPYEPTGFELETAAALCWFDSQHCDVALIECGLGGAQDATNVIENNMLTVLTSISLDHTALLGDTTEKIAEEKCGIIKNDTVVVSAQQTKEAERVIRLSCEKNNVCCNFVNNADIINKKYAEGLQSFDFGDYTNVKTSMLGTYQFENAALALKCADSLKKLGYAIPDESIYNGMKKARWGARFEIVHKNPFIIFDGAHNPDGAERLAESLKMYFKAKKLMFITGVFADKDYEKMLKATAPMAERIFTITAPGARGLDKESFAESVRKYNKNVQTAELYEAIDFCMKQKDFVTVLFGSLSFLGAADEYIRSKENG